MKIKISKALRKEINRQAGFKGKANKEQVVGWIATSAAVMAQTAREALNPTSAGDER